jgi:hypothetical protein
MLKKSGMLLGALLVTLAAASSPSIKPVLVQKVTCNCTVNAQCGSGNACCRLPGRTCGICC